MLLFFFWWVFRVKMCVTLYQVQDQIPWHESTSEKLNKNPFLQIKTAAVLFLFKHLNTLFT